MANERLVLDLDKVAELVVSDNGLLFLHLKSDAGRCELLDVDRMDSAFFRTRHLGRLLLLKAGEPQLPQRGPEELEAKIYASPGRRSIWRAGEPEKPTPPDGEWAKESRQPRPIKGRGPKFLGRIVRRLIGS